MVDNILTEDEIDALIEKNSKDGGGYVETSAYALVEDAIAAVIGKLGASDAVPVAWRDDGSTRNGSDSTEYRVISDETKAGMHTSLAASFCAPLYDATALAAARQQGRNEGREEAQAEINRDALVDLIAEHLVGTYHCTRVWAAWGVGTMSEDDFEPVDESDTPLEIADAILAARQPTQKEA